MRFKHWIIKSRKQLLRWLLTKAGLAYGTLDTEQAIRDSYRKGVEITEQKYARQRTIYTLEPLTPASPIVHVDPVGQRQMYHPPQVNMPPGDYFRQRHKEFLPTGELPSVKPAWLNELVQQQEMTEQDKQEASFLNDDKSSFVDDDETELRMPAMRKKKAG